MPPRSVPKIETMRSPLGRARGTGAARSGAGDWKRARISAIGLVPLSLWFILAILGHLGASQADIAAWAGRPLNAGLLLALVLLSFQHMALGLQVVWEDYMHKAAMREAAILATKGISLLLALTAAAAVLKLATMAPR